MVDDGTPTYVCLYLFIFFDDLHSCCALVSFSWLSFMLSEQFIHILLPSLLLSFISKLPRSHLLVFRTDLSLDFASFTAHPITDAIIEISISVDLRMVMMVILSSADVVVRDRSRQLLMELFSGRVHPRPAKCLSIIVKAVL